MRVVSTWTGRTAHLLRVALRMTNEQFADQLQFARRTVFSWNSDPHKVPTTGNQEVLDDALRGAPEDVQQRFWQLVDQSENVAAASNRPSTAPPAITSTQSLNSDVGGLFMAAASDATADTILRSGQLGNNAVTELRQQVIEAARDYGDMPPFGVFLQVKAVRDIAIPLSEQTRRPSDLADLYLVAGQSSALMASIAFDLGEWRSSAPLARAATSYAELAGDSSLQAWTLGLQATLANWRNDPSVALELIDRGLSLAPQGAPRYRLRYIASRTHALTGDISAAAEVLIRAQDDRADADGHRDTLQHEIRGEFEFGDARAAACACSAWLDLGNGDEAEQYAQDALASYLAIPETTRPFSQSNGARIDMATARLMRGELDGASDALEDVFALTSDRRNASLSGRLKRVKETLLAAQWVTDSAAIRLVQRIDDWNSDSALRALPD